MAAINHLAATASGPGPSARVRPAPSADRTHSRSRGVPAVTEANAGPLRIRLFPVAVGALPT